MKTSNLPLSDDLALVTGASGNIGSALAKRLAAGGAIVNVHYSLNQSAAQIVVEEVQKGGEEP
jgi:3-oxoacyl-[acyl-carrier protein] reductase